MAFISPARIIGLVAGFVLLGLIGFLVLQDKKSGHDRGDNPVLATIKSGASVGTSQSFEDVKTDLDPNNNVSAIEHQVIIDVSEISQSHEYKKLVDKHLMIKAHLASKRAASPDYQEVVKTLLRNGYGIGVVQPTVNVVLLLTYSEEQIVNRLTDSGVWEDFDNRLKSELQKHRDHAEKQLRRDAGIYDDKLITELLNLRILNPGRVLELESLVPLNDGEWLLTDSDWLTTGYREAMDQHTAERIPDMSFQERMKAWSNYQRTRLSRSR